jgi:hypothetical protein
MPWPKVYMPCLRNHMQVSYVSGSHSCCARVNVASGRITVPHLRMLASDGLRSVRSDSAEHDMIV